MTRYDEPGASDGYGGPHPLAGVPQSALDAAYEALNAGGDLDIMSLDEAKSLAEAILMAGLIEIRKQQASDAQH